MATSYRNINYGLRPAKTIERKMLCEAFSRLTPFGKVESYVYIGFGSTYFNDFILFHKVLNICNMISIEKDKINMNRFLFNQPFNCIDVKFGKSNDELPKLSWNCRALVWLDYEGKLDSDVLADVKYVCANATPGSVVVVTINTNQDYERDKDMQGILDELKEAVGVEKVSPSISIKDLQGWGYANVCRKIINNTIYETLHARNGGKASGTRYIYKQLFNFNYQDRAKMMTTGGLLHDEGQETLFTHCAFHNLSYIRNSDDAYKIEVPNLTYKEIRKLDEQLPRKNGSIPNLPDVPPADIEKYEKIYRYFPNFAEANV